jgi:phosphoglycolate phosphatase-like HAD superfamily hydrolase
VPIYGIIFDLDGTLTIPILNFKELRKQMDCPPPPVDIREYISSKPENEKARLLKIVEDFEDEGNKIMKLQPGVHTLLKFLAENGLKRAVLTRNAKPCVELFLDKLGEPSQYGGPFCHVSYK